MTTTPKIWRDMTDAEKGALLQVGMAGMFGFKRPGSGWVFGPGRCASDTHRITFDTIDGEPDCTSIKMEKL